MKIVQPLEELAEVLYTDYCAAVGGKAFDGAVLPDWKTFRADPKKQVQSDAWLRAARSGFKWTLERVTSQRTVAIDLGGMDGPQQLHAVEALCKFLSQQTQPDHA